MPRVYLGVGSNVDRERHVVLGLDALEALLGDLAVSPVYDCPAIGYRGAAFLNLVVGADTRMALGELAARLRAIERVYGRPPDATASTPRQLDIDILTYGDLTGRVDGIDLPRAEILRNAFVLRPLADLAPDARHPLDGRRYEELWACYNHNAQPICRVDFQWRGRPISRSEA